MNSFGSSRSIRLPSTLAVLALAAAAFGPGASGCALSTSIDDVLQPPDGVPTGGTGGTGGTSVAGSTSTTSSGTGQGGSGSGSTAAGGESSGEDCTDGADNDGDGLEDCADSDCKPGYECVDAAPSEATGLYRVDKSPGAGSKQACAGGSSPDLYRADPAGPAECSPCSCGDVTGATCLPLPIACFPGSTNCQGNPQNWTAAANAAACVKPTNLLGNSQTLSCALTGAAAVNEKGACQASKADFTNKETWGSAVAACAVASVGGGCGGAQVCVPKAPLDTPQSVCIKQEGTTKCPAGWGAPIQAFADGNDTRGCAACQCGDSSATCAGGSYSFFDFDACDAGTQSPPTDITSNACKNVSPLLDSATWSASVEPPQASGSCPPSGGQPTGAVDTSGPVTFCCK